MKYNTTLKSFKYKIRITLTYAKNIYFIVHFIAIKISYKSINL